MINKIKRVHCYFLENLILLIISTLDVGKMNDM